MNRLLPAQPAPLEDAAATNCDSNSGSYVHLGHQVPYSEIQHLLGAIDSNERERMTLFKRVARANRHGEIEVLQQSFFDVERADLIGDTARQLEADAVRLETCTLTRVLTTGHALDINFHDNIVYTICRAGLAKIESQNNRVLLRAGDRLISTTSIYELEYREQRDQIYKGNSIIVSTYKAIERLRSYGYTLKSADIFCRIDQSSDVDRSLYDVSAAVCEYLGTMLQSPMLSRRLSSIDELILEEVCMLLINLGFARKKGADSEYIHAKIAERAEEFMRDGLYDSLSLLQMSRALGTSQRRMQYAFQEIHNQTPREFLQRMHLNRIREVLKNPHAGMTVTNVALEFGVTHPGRFAGAYKRLFGEPPSQTLRDARLKAEGCHLP